MRITNMMTTNRMYNSITKNKTIVDKYYTQLASGKRIQYASENPILASRILKFRATLSEAEQYKDNVKQGYSWLEVSEQAVSTIEDIMQRIRDLAEQGANGTYDINDREMISTDIKGLISEIGMQMNQTYGGRYVFSGYRTDTEPVFTEKNNFNYQITQDFNYMDFDSFKVYSKIGLNDIAEVFDATRIKLPYKDAENISIKTSQKFTVDTLAALPATPPNEPDINYIEDINAFMLPNDTRDEILGAGEISIAGKQYDIVNSAPPSPADQTKVYYNAVLNTFHFPDGLTKEFNSDGATLPLNLEADPSIAVNNVSSNDADAYKPAAGTVNYIKDTGELIFADDVAQSLTALGRDGFQITYDKNGFSAGEPNPKVYFNCKDLSDGKRYDMSNQNLEYEFGINIRISVNNLAKDMFTANMYADFMEFCTFADSVKISEKRDLELYFSGDPYFYSGAKLDEAVKNQLAEETKRSSSVSQMRFESLIGSIDKYKSIISKQRTDLGSRMSRLELIENRLGDDIVSYTGLLSDNEDADMMESVMYLNITEAIYQASMNIGARILQTSLVDFLR